MGLLDQVLGQVIGNMAGQGQGRQPSPPAGGMGDILGQILGGAGGRAPQGSAGGGVGDILGQILKGGQGAPPPAPAPAPSPAPSGGGLPGGLGSILAGAGGKYSPLVLAVLAILASKHLSSGAGGFGSVLHDMFSGGRKSPDAGAEPDGYARGPQGAGQEPEGYEGEDAYGEPPEGSGAPPYEQPRGGGGDMRARGDGGFLNDVGSMLDGPGSSPPQSGAGNVLGGGFDDLQRQFEQNGQGGLMDSWIGQGANRDASPNQLEQALGSGTIDQLARQFGIDRNELLQQLSHALPQIVDGLTPNGRPPTAQEQRSWI